MSPRRFPLSMAAEPEPVGLPRWRALLALGARLPGGLVHADRVTIVARPPPFLSPLTAGSRWHALGRGLVVTADLDDGGVEALLRDLAAYRSLSLQLRARLAERAGAAEALAADDLAPDVALALQDLFEASPRELALVFGRAPGLRADLAGMLRRAFDPEIVVHAELTEARQIQAGRDIAQALLARIPAGRFHLLVADDPAPVELLSPYPVDLGHSLYQWGIENPGRLPIAGLADALEGTQGEPERDLASVVAATLTQLAEDPVRRERRQNEASQGLWLEDAWGATWGIADLARLEAPDPVALRTAPPEVLALVVGGSAALRVEALSALAESGRLEGIGVVARAGMAGAEPMVPEAVLWSDDAIRIELGVALARFSTRVGIDARRIGAVEAAGGAGAPPWIRSALQRWRRARITGALDAQARPLLALAPTGDRRDLAAAHAYMDATRLVLAGLLDPELTSRAAGHKTRSSGRDAGVSRRFRA